MKSPDLNLLPIAFALYDELSVSRAARLLGMSQPAVSMALKRMRIAFDDPLFIRVLDAASKLSPRSRSSWSLPSSGRASRTMAWARGVGVTPLGTRMNSGSSKAMRIRFSAMLTAGLSLIHI